MVIFPLAMLSYNRRTLREVRRGRLIDTDTLGRRARISGRAVRKLEAGAIPRADTLGRLASVLGVGVDAFYIERRIERRKRVRASAAGESAA